MSKNFFQKLRLNVVLFFNSLFRGMRAADDIISTNSKDGTAGNGTGEERKVENDNVYAALVRGEITQEVKDLRYETYQAVKKADEYKYVGNGVAVKKDKNQIFNKAKTKVFNKEDLSVYMIQINDLIKASVSETLSAAQNGKEPEEKHRININRKWFPRFKLENYATQIVVRTKEEGGYIIDFYVPDAPRDFNPKDIYFDKEMQALYNQKARMSDIIDFDNINFISEKAFPIEDMLEFSFINMKYREINKFNGSYVLSFDATADKLGDDIAKEMYDAESERKFNKKEPRKNMKATPISEAIENLERLENKKKFDETKSKELLAKIKANKNKKEESHTE